MSKIKNLPEIVTLDDNDIFYTVDNSAGTNGGRKITKANLKEEMKQSDANIKAAYEANGNTNAFTDAEKSKLAGIEANAKDDQNAEEVPYDNNESGATATNVKDGLDELFSGKENAFNKNTAFNKDFGFTANTVVQGNDLRLQKAQVLNVQKNPGNGQFSSVKDAVESISDASSSKPYLISIGPGIYNEDPFTLSSYINLRGERGATVLQANESDIDFITIAGDTSISEIVVTGVTSPGFSAIKRTGGSGVSTLRDVEFGSSDSLVTVDSTGGAPQMVLDGVLIRNNVEFSQGFNCFGTGNGSISILNLSAGLVGAGINSGNLVRVAGPGNILSVKVGQIQVTAPASLAAAIKAEDGANIAVFDFTVGGADVGLDIANIGAGQRVIVSDLNIIDSVTNDVLISNPNATGFISGAFATSKTTIDENAMVSVTHADPSDSDIGFVVVGEIYQGSTQSEVVNISKLNKSTAPLGLLEGGALTQGATPLQIDIAEGNGFVEDDNETIREVNWEATSINLPAESLRYITVNDSGLVQAEASLPEFFERRVILGRVVTTDDRVVRIVNSSLDVHHHGNKMERTIRQVFGALYSSGSLISENASTNRGIDATPGLYFFGTSRFTPSGGEGLSFAIAYRDGGGDFQLLTPVTSVVPNDIYDDNSGITQAVPTGQYVKHVVVLSGDGIYEKYSVVLGQATYGSQLDAENAPLPQLPIEVDGPIVKIAAVITQEGNDNFATIQDIRPTPSFAGVATSSVTDHGSLSGLTDDDHQQYLLAAGGRAMTGNLDMGSNNITNVGTVNGISVTTHASRHLPNGADPLASAAPSTSLSGNTSNATGVANSFSRSDHTHAIELATTILSGLMSATDKTKLNGIENEATADQLASEVPYDNGTSGLSSTNAQDAIDENAGQIATTENLRALHVNGGPNKHDATEIDYERTGAERIDIQETSNDIESAVTDLDNNKLSRTGSQAMTGNLNMNTNNITNVGTVNGVTVQSHASRHLPGGADALSTAAASSISGDTTNTEGSASTFARSDHTHNILTGTTSTISAATANAEGSAAQLARADHTHQISTGVVSTQLPAQANAAGTSPNLAKADHIHNIPVAAAVELTDSSNTEGSASTFARSDHTHSHGNRGGGSLHSAVTTSVNGFMSAADKVKLNRMDVGHLSYSSAATQTTTSTSFISVPLATDRESFTNSLFTKVNATDFRADFTGQVKVSYTVSSYPDANDRATEIGIQRNSTDLVWTVGQSNAKADPNRKNSTSGSFILNCTANDIFRLRARSVEAALITIPANQAFMSVEVYRIA